MPTGLENLIENLPVDTLLPSQEAQLLGVRRSNHPSHSRQLKQNIFLQHMLPNKFYGIIHYSENLKSTYQQLRQFSQTIKLLLQLHTIPNFMHEPNTLTFHFIFFVIW